MNGHETAFFGVYGDLCVLWAGLREDLLVILQITGLFLEICDLLIVDRILTETLISLEQTLVVCLLRNLLGNLVRMTHVCAHLPGISVRCVDLREDIGAEHLRGEHGSCTRAHQPGGAAVGHFSN